MAEKTGLRAAVVDRYSGTKWYTWRLFEEISRILPESDTLYYYGPKKRKDIAETNPRFKPVWTSKLYPFQILSQALKDKIDVIHLQFEFVTFGSPYTSLLLIPLLILLKLAGIKIVVTLHGPIFPRKAGSRMLEVLSPSSSIPPFLLLTYCKITYKMMDLLADSVIVHAEIFKLWLAEMGIRKVRVVPHGIEIFNLLPAADGQKNDIILCFGVVSPRKGLENLIQSFAAAKGNLNGYKLVIAGGEPSWYKGYLDILKKYATDQGVADNVMFTGYIKDDDVKALFEQALVVVAPYPFSISASGVLAQAMGFGKPIIASLTEYSAEILDNGNDALLVPAGDITAMGDAMQNLVHDQALREKLAANVKIKAQKYRWPLVAENTINIYKQTSGKNQGK